MSRLRFATLDMTTSYIYPVLVQEPISAAPIQRVFLNLRASQATSPQSGSHVSVAPIFNRRIGSH